MVPQELKNNLNMGPVALTVLLNSGLLGVLSVQVFLYYLAFNDRVYMKCLVYGIYILELTQSILITESVFRNYELFFTGFGVEALERTGTTWFSFPILTAICTSIVQGFYARRISVLARSKKIAGAIIALSLIQLGGGIATGVRGQQTKYYSSFNAPNMVVPRDTAIGIWNVGAALCDIIIAVCMTYYLSRYDTTIKQTKAILKKIIRLTIETGTLTAMIGIVCFSLSLVPGVFAYPVPMGVIGKIYANSMLVLINSRMVLSSEETPTSSTGISVLKFTNPKDSALEADNGDLAEDTRAGEKPRPGKIQSPRQFKLSSITFS